MGKELYNTYEPCKALFDQANEILGYDLTKLCFEGPASDLDSTVHSQPALFVCSLAALEKLRQEKHLSRDVLDYQFLMQIRR